MLGKEGSIRSASGLPRSSLFPNTDAWLRLYDEAGLGGVPPSSEPLPLVKRRNNVVYALVAFLLGGAFVFSLFACHTHLSTGGLLQTAHQVPVGAQVFMVGPAQSENSTDESPCLDAAPEPNSIESDALSKHNSFRAQYGAAALTWDNTLARKAQQWANGCKFKHS